MFQFVLLFIKLTLSYDYKGVFGNSFTLERVHGCKQFENPWPLLLWTLYLRTIGPLYKARTIKHDLLHPFMRVDVNVQMRIMFVKPFKWSAPKIWSDLQLILTSLNCYIYWIHGLKLLKSWSFQGHHKSFHNATQGNLQGWELKKKIYFLFAGGTTQPHLTVWTVWFSTESGGNQNIKDLVLFLLAIFR